MRAGRIRQIKIGQISQSQMPNDRNCNDVEGGKTRNQYGNVNWNQQGKCPAKCPLELINK